MKFGLDTYKTEKREIPDAAMRLELPVMPPSTNNLYWNVPGRGRVKTRQYDDWLHQCGLILKRQVVGRLIGRVDILIRLEDKHPNRDCDNTVKPICDLLKKVGAIMDDRAKFVRSVKAEWAPISGVEILIVRAA
jgi:Holliday junction resolvase RusA-like endonuclease